MTEAQNANEELFGEERLLNSLNAERNVSMEPLCRKGKEAVDAFAGEAEQFDDITMLAVKFAGMEAP